MFFDKPRYRTFGKAKHPLDHIERMLDLGASRRLRAVLVALHLVDNPTMAVTPTGEVFRIRRALADAACRPW